MIISTGNNINSLKNFYFQHKINTRWRDMDSFGHINNGTYLAYIEDARTALFNRWNIRNDNKSIIVASIKIDYINQIAHPSKLIVGSMVSRLGNSSFDILSSIFMNNNKKPCAVSLVTCVCYDYKNNKSIKIFDEIKSDYLTNSNSIK